MSKQWQIFLMLIIAIVFAEIQALNPCHKVEVMASGQGPSISIANSLSEVLPIVSVPNPLVIATNNKSITDFNQIVAVIDSDNPSETPTDPEVEKARIQEETLGVLREWARQQPEKALEWALHQPDGSQRHEVLVDVCYQVAQSDPATALFMAQQLHLNQGQGAVIENLVQQWAAQDVSAAYIWAQAQPTAEEKNGFMARIAFVQAQTDPADAARLVVEQITPGQTQAEAVMTVLHQWALQDMQEANTWAQLFPAGALRDRAMNELNGMLQTLTAE